jgi:hypothetical protein
LACNAATFSPPRLCRYWVVPAYLLCDGKITSNMARVPAEVNRLSNQVLVTTYEAEWGKVGR